MADSPEAEPGQKAPQSLLEQPSKLEQKPAPRPARKNRLPYVIGVSSIVLLLGGFASLWFFRSPLDVTEQACEDGTLELLKTSEHPVEVALFASPEPALLAESADRVGHELERLAEGSGGKLKYTRVNVKDDVTRAQASSEGIQQALLGQASSAGTSLNAAYFGVALKSGDQRATIPAIDPERPQDFPYWFANRLREVIARAEQQSFGIGLVSSPGGVSLEEPSLSAKSEGSMLNLLASAFPYYRFSLFTPDELDATKLESVDTLVVTQPGRDFTKAELERIDEFLMRGDKSLVVLTSAVNIPPGDGTMSVTLSRHGLEPLLEGYGVELSSDLVVDTAHGMKLKGSLVGGGEIPPDPTLIVLDNIRTEEKNPSLVSSSPLFQGVSQVTLPFASTLVLHPDQQKNTTFTPLLFSSEQARSATKGGISTYPGKPLPEELSPPERRTLAVAIDGDLKSAFSEKSARARVLVIASSQLVTNPLARAGKPATPDAAKQGGGSGDPTLAGISQYYDGSAAASSLLLRNILDWSTEPKSTRKCALLLRRKASD
ncbi:MAG: GldG family protein [Polyangiaceae bacterium]|nr:GldG family protein [Myxococcales bacterium]MCB9588396.1 GldG family protein [Polyangiaceae bacterium]